MRFPWVASVTQRRRRASVQLQYRLTPWDKRERPDHISWRGDFWCDKIMRGSRYSVVGTPLQVVMRVKNRFEQTASRVRSPKRRTLYVRQRAVDEALSSGTCTAGSVWQRSWDKCSVNFVFLAWLGGRYEKEAPTRTGARTKTT
jgi:hypothetical protein